MQLLQAINVVLDAAGYAPVSSVTASNRAADVARNALELQRTRLLDQCPAFALLTRDFSPTTSGEVFVGADVIRFHDTNYRRIGGLLFYRGAPVSQAQSLPVYVDLPFEDLPRYAQSLVAYRAAVAQVSSSDELLRRAAQVNQAAAEQDYISAYLRDYPVVLRFSTSAGR